MTTSKQACVILLKTLGISGGSNAIFVGYKSHIPKILANTAHGIDFDGRELYQSTEEFEEWPEELQGTLSAVVCIDKITCQ